MSTIIAISNNITVTSLERAASLLESMQIY